MTTAIMKPSNNSLEHRLAGKETEVLAMCDREGESHTMKFYRIKTRRTFLQWVARHSPPPEPISIPPPLKGGDKQLWIKQHVQTIIDMCRIRGTDFVLRELNLQPDTLDDILRYRDKPALTGSWTKADRASLKADYVMAGYEELRHELDQQKARVDVLQASLQDTQDMVRLLFNSYSEFTSRVSGNIAKGILEPLVRSLMPRDNELVEAPMKLISDSLNVERIIQDEKMNPRRVLTIMKGVKRGHNDKRNG